jgi:hypothetical protein
MLNADRWQLSGRDILCFSTPWMSPDGEYGTLGAGGGGGCQVLKRKASQWTIEGDVFGKC